MKHLENMRGWRCRHKKFFRKTLWFFLILPFVFLEYCFMYILVGVFLLLSIDIMTRLPEYGGWGITGRKQQAEQQYPG
jgi:hypothetical protein